jgi:Protein of unknown function (DUF3014)
MASLDDLPLDTGRGDAATVAPSAPSSPGPRVALLVILVAAVLAAGVGVYVARQRASTATAPSAAGALVGAGQTVTDAPPLAPARPPLEQMDPFVRELFTTLGSHQLLLKWLATDDLVGSIATAIDRLAQGQSPARDLAVLRPTPGFAVTRRDGLALVTPASYARYAPLADAVASVDPETLAAAFVTLRPRLAEAYARQGHPDGGFDEAVTRALAVVTTTPDIPEDAALVPGAGGFAYANPTYEQLPPAQKQLVRMGPDHVRRVREAARRFADALAATPRAR